MLRFDDLQLFVRTAETGSLSAAARLLDVSPAVASAALKRLEQQLQVRLLARSTRSLRLTPEGERVLASAHRMLHEREALRQELGDAIEFVQPQGGLFVWARLTGAHGRLADGNELARRAIDQGVAFVPGAPFFCANPDVATLRLSFATADVAKIREGVGRLAQALRG